MSATYDQIASALSHLGQSQLIKLRAQITFLLQHQPNSQETRPVEDEDWLLLGILAELRRRGLDSRSNFRIRKESSYASFRAQSETVRGHLARLAPNLTAVQRRALGEICAYELARYLESWHSRPRVDRNLMLMYVSKVPEALDYAYPGYMASGLLHVIVA